MENDSERDSDFDNDSDVVIVIVIYDPGPQDTVKLWVKYGHLVFPSNWQR